MILLSSGASGSARRVVLLGLGLIGEAISDFLLARGYVVSLRRNSPWKDSGALYRQLIVLAGQGSLEGAPCIDLVWAAGTAGFAAGESECAKELEVFEAFVVAVEQIRDSGAAGMPLRVHLISSAGGLYEGQRLVDTDSQPAPSRPYGRLKLRQERLCTDRLGTFDTLIYRLSSVYGYIRPGKRLGLVTTLLGNTLSQRMTRISGRLDTLRDYLWVEDAAGHIGGRILAEEGSTGAVSILASSRPASIHEIRSIVQRATNRPSYVYCANRENAAHITFARSALPAGFAPSMLETCAGRILLDAMSKGGAWPRKNPLVA